MTTMGPPGKGAVLGARRGFPLPTDNTMLDEATEPAVLHQRRKHTPRKECIMTIPLDHLAPERIARDRSTHLAPVIGSTPALVIMDTDLVLYPLSCCSFGVTPRTCHFHRWSGAGR
jgi:hypothetical protein